MGVIVAVSSLPPHLSCVSFRGPGRHSIRDVVHFGLFRPGLYHANLSSARVRMDKSIWTSEYAVLLELLREARESAGLTQVELAEKIGQSQSFVSKIEIGERRLDLIQLRSICLTIGTTLPAFVAQLEQRLGKKKKTRVTPA